MSPSEPETVEAALIYMRDFGRRLGYSRLQSMAEQALADLQGRPVRAFDGRGGNR